MKRILYLPFDHLHKQYGVLREANPESDLIVMVESQRMVTGEQWNKVRLYFLISAALHFVDELRADGFIVEYLQRPTTHDGLVDIARQYPGLPLVAAQASSYRLTQTLAENNVQIIPNDFFLTSRPDFALWAGKQKSFLDHHFGAFGPYEDAMTTENWALSRRSTCNGCVNPLSMPLLG